MAGLLSGIAHAAAQGAGAWAQGTDDRQRKMLAIAAQRRQQKREEEEDELKRISALAGAREAGLIVGPQGGSRSGDTPPTENPVGPSITPEAGPAAQAPPTRIGSIKGMDISMPEKYESKSIRDKRAAIAAGVERAPQQTLPERISELRSQGMSIEEAMRTARMEHGQSDPGAQHRENRLFDIKNPLPKSGGGKGGTPEQRANYVLRRAAQLTKPTVDRTGYTPKTVPGMSRTEAEAQAGEEYDRQHGAGKDTDAAPPDRTAPSGMAGARRGATSPSGNIDLRAPGAPRPTAKPLTPTERKRASVDPAYAAFKRSQGFQVR